MDNGSLDVVCGFTVIDEDSRTVVLEGMCGARGGLSELLASVGRAGPNGQAYRALENPEVRFSGRLYTAFGTDLKKVIDSLVLLLSVVSGVNLLKAFLLARGKPFFVVSPCSYIRVHVQLP